MNLPVHFTGLVQFTGVFHY